MKVSKKMRVAATRKRRGLILLIVLGMLAMFSLLAVTYVITSSSSILGSRALRVRERNAAFDLSNLRATDKVVAQLVRGTNNQDSPFYMNNLLGDVYGPDAIRTTFGPYIGNDTVIPITGPLGSDPERNVNLVKVSLLRDAELNGPLSPIENEYNSRVLTVLEGPLAGVSFRILKYVGFVNDGSTPDPNLVVQPDFVTGGGNRAFETPWMPYIYNDPNAPSLRYSVLIDLNDISTRRVTGEVVANDGTFRSETRSVQDWIAEFGAQTLFFAKTTTAPPSPANMSGYKLLINDAPFNYPGIGIEDVAGITTATTAGAVNSFGNIDSRGIFARPRVSPSLLTHYDYLNDPVMMRTNPFNGTVGVDGISTKRADHREQRLIGASNEGIDVPDWRDAWLAHDTYVGGVRQIIPSFHRPEVINHIAHLFGNPSSMTPGDVQEMLRLINASTGRVMNVQFGTIQWNTRFQANNTFFPKLTNLTWSNPPTATEIATLRGYVAMQINGSNNFGNSVYSQVWDVDNDKDGQPDSVWIDPGLEIVYAPDGRRLKPLAALMTLDMDSRVNLNVAGDRTHGLAGFDVPGLSFAKRLGPISQGFGYGPAEISLKSLFVPDTTGTLLRSTTGSFSFFDDRYGARRFRGVRYPMINYLDPSLDRVPGRRRVGVSPYENDPVSQIAEREQHAGFGSSRMPGLPLARRGTTSLAFDVFGNPVMANPAPEDGDPYQMINVNSFVSDVLDDPYEANAMGRPNLDDPLGLEELEALLRRFDADTARLPTRLKEYLSRIPGYSNVSEINREMTTRSAELRHPNIAAAFKTVKDFNNGQGPIVSIDSGAPSYIRYIQMLHSQRYIRNRTPLGVNGASVDDPSLSIAAISELFPVEFSQGLRMDLNRPFGDGFDSGSGQVGDIDEPAELTSFEQERGVGPAGVVFAPAAFPAAPVTATESLYGRELKQVQRKVDGSRTLPALTRRALAGRQVLARNLYCLAQLIVPRDFEFPGMDTFNANTPLDNWRRAKIRARALAQWAVNVVDFRDADSSMTRFEYDILPFGNGTTIGGPASLRPAYWAPDHILEVVNSVPNRVYCDVVWGVEAPELLMTETFAYHNKNLKNTDMDTSGLISDPSNSSSDQDLDQFRFPDAGLLIELYNPRSVGPGDDPTFAGTSRALYSLTGGNNELDLSRVAPSSPTWGQQPVWRIAISEPYQPTNENTHPQKLLENDTLSQYSLQHSTETIDGTTATRSARFGDIVNATNVEAFLGNGLVYQPNNTAILDSGDPSSLTTNAASRMPVAFDRFIWFTPSRPGSGTMGARVPDLAVTTPSEVPRHVYCATAPVTLPGTSYLVVGPKGEIPFGSLTHNQFTGYDYRLNHRQLLRATMSADVNSRPQLSPSYQRFNLNGGLFVAKNLVDRDVNAPWMTASKTPKSVICTTLAPDASWEEESPTRPRIFKNGVGINVSLPTPIAGQSIWIPDNLPTKSVNSGDRPGGPQGRADNTPGFGSIDVVPPDSWVDLANPGSDAYPDEPIDRSNPLIGGADRYRSGSYENVRAAYLQRLADPSVAYDPVMNPYITVDWMSIDLTVFNGETDEEYDERDSNAQMFDTNFIPSPRPTFFQARYKTGQMGVPAVGDTGISYLAPNNVWRPNGVATFPKQSGLPNLPPLGGGSNPQVNPESFIMFSLGHEKTVSSWNGAGASGASATSFGYLNFGDFEGTGTSEPSFDEINNSVGPRVGRPRTDSTAFGAPLDNAVPLFKGAGDRMANILWVNRQFATPNEILMVPRSSAGLLGVEYGRYSDLPAAQNNRQSPAHLNSFQATNRVESRLPFPATPPVGLNQIWAAFDSYWAIPKSNGDWLGDWNLILDFVETNAPFLDGNRHLRPDLMYNAANSDLLRARLLNSFLGAGYFGNADSHSYRGPSLLAPFNMIPSYRAPGKINLNTVSFDSTGNSRALKAIEHLYFTGAANRDSEFGPASNGFVNAFRESRQGYASGGGNVNLFFQSPVNADMNPDFPTRFAGAFRSSLGSNLAPPSAISPDANAKLRSQHPVDVTLLRGDRLGLPLLSEASDLSNDQLLFRNPSGTDAVAQAQVFDRLQRAIRLPNLTTNQSNVFAVWVTVGLFEYDPITGFGAEYVDETGGVKRERKFYIIDRSIPVGFKQGEDLNYRQTVLLERTLP
ncbi:hypothetical protein SH501x_000083 [Pirellulaceae bacterium SH501]